LAGFDAGQKNFRGFLKTHQSCQNDFVNLRIFYPVWVDFSRDCHLNISGCMAFGRRYPEKKGARYPCTTGIREQKETPEDRYKRSAGLWKDRIQQHLPPICSCQNEVNKTLRWTAARKNREKK